MGFLGWSGGHLGRVDGYHTHRPVCHAYFSAYPGYDIPPLWVAPLKDTLGRLLTFAPPVAVYNLYGRIYNLVYLLFVPAVFGLHTLHRGDNSKVERWGFGMLVVGLVVAFIGVAGDYWADGAGFLLAILGLLICSIGATLYGVATLQSRVLPPWCAWLLVACLPGVFIFLLLIGHIPSGPTFLFAVVWLIIGYMLLFKQGIRPYLAVQGAG